MITILCYGDSNTWGYDVLSQGRLPINIRWTGVLRNQLGPNYWVIEEGLNGRTTVWDDPVEGEWKNGLRYLIPCLESHAPLDLVVLMLGTNDLKMRFSVPPTDIALGIERLIRTIQVSASGPNQRPPQILLLSPPPVGRFSDYEDMFTGATEKSQKLEQYYRQIAELYNCHYLDTSIVIQSGDVNGVHFSAEDHGKLGRTVADIVERIKL
jgi:lysophospholipase L1-like esterase